jgi:hypothetical protein
MANSDKNILITPNKNASDKPEIALTGFGNSTTTIKIDDDSFANVSFESGTTKILSANNKKDGSLFGVSDNVGNTMVEVSDIAINLGTSTGKVIVGSDGIQLPEYPSTGLPQGEEGLVVYDNTIERVRVWNGSIWSIVGQGNDGRSAETAGISAEQIKSDYPNSTDGVYWIDLPRVGPTQVYCLMDSIWDGGGWMMMMKAANTGTTFSYFANYWTTNNVLNPTDLTRNNADAKYQVMNNFAAKDMMAVWPDITVSTTSWGSVRKAYNESNRACWSWLENNFWNGGARITPIGLFNTAATSSGIAGSGIFLRDAKTFTGWASGIFSSQVDIRFYGFNYVNQPNYGLNMRSRWGFGWNENSEGLYPGGSSGAAGSNDVSGGIGLDAGAGNLSAGDRINCCQDSSGINRQARVEIYVR